MKKPSKHPTALATLFLTCLLFGSAALAEPRSATAGTIEELRAELESITAQLRAATAGEQRLGRRQEDLQDRLSALAESIEGSENEIQWRSDDDWDDFADNWGEFWGEFGEQQGEFWAEWGERQGEHWGEFGERLGETIVEIVETLVAAFD